MQILTTPRSVSPSGRTFTVNGRSFRLLLPLMLDAVSPGLLGKIRQAFTDVGYVLDAPVAPIQPEVIDDAALEAYTQEVTAYLTAVDSFKDGVKLLTSLYALLLLDDEHLAFDMPFDRLAFLRSPDNIVDLAIRARDEMYTPEVLLTVDLRALMDAINLAVTGAPGN